MSATVPPVPPVSRLPSPTPALAATTHAPTDAAPVEIVVATSGPYAGLATRTLAFSTDAAVITVIGWFVALVVGLGLSLLDLPPSVSDILVEIGAAIAVCWAIGYFTFFWSTTGQTPGNRLFKIRVLDVRTGQPPRPRRAFARYFGVLLSAILLCTGFLLILVDGRRRALHDRLVRTIVVDVADEPQTIRSDVKPHDI
jgi:uncharacterized RDD family membrane protein YckC